MFSEVGLPLCGVLGRCAHSYSLTIVTGQWACLTTESEMLPISALLILPRPLLPITINPASRSAAKSTISSSALPSLKCASLRVPPASSTLLTSSSSRRRASRSSSALLLSSTLTLAENFQNELEQRAFEGLLLLPTSERALFYAKALANWTQLAVLGAALIPVMVVLYDAGTTDLLRLAAIVLLGSAGLSAPGTLYAAMSAGTKGRQMLLPLLLFPLVVPLLLASVKATSLIILGDPMGQMSSWTTLLIAFDAIYWSLCGLLFGKLVEE